MDIDTMVESHFKKNQDPFGFESFLELIEEVMKECGVPSALLMEAEEGGTKPKSETFTFDLIPTIPINELGWGGMHTPGEGKEGPSAPMDPPARKQLSQYLRILGEGNITDKLNKLNQFLAEDFTPTSGSPGQQLRETISYLVFYKTLTSIITSFNAASAGFAFESFLAIMLDAEGGKQIPASGASTIADIELTGKGGKRISVKLYKEGSLKVGGSYKQLVDDLVPEDGEAGAMEYVAVTKDVSGDGPNAEGQLNFYGFTFTLQNFLSILGVKGKEKDLMRLPTEFMKPLEELEVAAEAGSLEQLLAMPSRSDVDLAPIVASFTDNMREKMLAADFDEAAVQRFEDEFARLVNPETGIYVGTEEKPKRFAFRTNPKTGMMGGGGKMIKQITDDRDERARLTALVLDVYADSLKARKRTAGKGTKRKQKFEELKFMSPLKSYKRLLALQEAGASPALIRLAMKSTAGYLKNMQFDLSKTDLEKMAAMSAGDDPAIKGSLPYGEFKLGFIEIGVQKVQAVLDRSVDIFNTTIFSIFTDLKTLSTSLNTYVAGGLNDPEEARKAETAAGDIATGTAEVAADSGAESPTDLAEHVFEWWSKKN